MMVFRGRSQGKTQHATPPASTVNAEDVARIAYELYEQRGCVNGHDLEDWLRAEAIARSRRRSSK